MRLSLSNIKMDYLKELKIQMNNEEVCDEYYDACVGYAERLAVNGMPVIFDLTHLSMIIGMKESTLRQYSYLGFDLSYHTIHISKKCGGLREINAPSVRLKELQKWLLNNVIDKMHCSQNATGFRRGCSIVENARRHLGKKCILNMDIKDFFPSIKRKDIYNIFRYYGYTWQLSDFFADLCTLDDSLPQGAPTSPALSNVRCLKLDKRLSSLCMKCNLIYSRYADDITISGDSDLTPLIDVITEIIHDDGFLVNRKKTRVLFQHQKQEITGLVINSNKVTVPREYKRKLSQEIYYCKKYGPHDHQKHVGDTHSFYKEHLYGKAYYIKMVEPMLGKQFLEELDKIEWDY